MISNELLPIAESERSNPEVASPGFGQIIAVMGGKGGIGKTNIATNLAIAASGCRARVLLVDGDLGLANIDVLLGLAPSRSAAEILAGDCDFEDALVSGPGGIDLLPAASARMDLASSRPSDLTHLLAPLLAAIHRYDLILIDIGSGVAALPISIASICDRALLVTTPEPTSVRDAYGTLKVLRRAAPELPVELLVNGVQDELQAMSTHRQIERVGERFLKHRIPMRGYLSHDPRLAEAVLGQRAVVEAFPASVVSRQLINLAADLVAESSSRVPAPPSRRWRRMSP